MLKDMLSETNLLIVWLAVFVTFLVIEAITVSLVSIWFAGGAIAAFFTALITDRTYVQFLVFIIFSLIFILLVRPVAKKKFSTKLTATNTQALIGTEALVTENIDNIHGTGKIIIRGMEWTARSSENEEIPTGTIVTVKKIQGVKAIVSQTTE